MHGLVREVATLISLSLRIQLYVLTPLQQRSSLLNPTELGRMLSSSMKSFLSSTGDRKSEYLLDYDVEPISVSSSFALSYEIQKNSIEGLTPDFLTNSLQKFQYNIKPSSFGTISMVLYQSIPKEDCTNNSLVSLLTNKYVFLDSTCLSSKNAKYSLLGAGAALTSSIIDLLTSFLDTFPILDDTMNSRNVYVPMITLQYDTWSTTTPELPSIKNISTWIEQESLPDQHIHLSSILYYVSEHPQVAVALASAQRSSPGQRPYIDSRLFLNEIEEIGDYYFAKLLDRSGHLMSMDYYVHGDLRRSRERRDKIADDSTLSLLSRLFGTNPKKSKNVSGRLKSKSSEGWSLKKMKIFEEERGLVVARDVALLPVFILRNPSYSIDTISSITFENNQRMSIVDGVLMIIISDKDEVDEALERGLLAALAGISPSSEELSLRRDDPENILTWRAKRSVLVQRGVRLCEALTTLRESLSMDWRDAEALPPPLKTHLEAIRMHKQLMDDQVREIRELFATPDATVTGISAALVQSETNFDELFIQTIKLQQEWKREMARYTIKHQWLGFSTGDVPASSVTRGVRRMTIIAVVALIVLGTMAKVIQIINERAKKLK